MGSNTYAKSLSDAASILNIPYSQLYRHKHRPEFQKSARGYNIKNILEFIEEQDRIKEEEAKQDELMQQEEEFIEKQIKLETARHKCRLLELQIKQKEGNLIEVDKVLETRTKEISLLRKNLSNLINKLPVEGAGLAEDELRTLSTRFVNEILADIAELIQDDWESDSIEQEDEIDE